MNEMTLSGLLRQGKSSYGLNSEFLLIEVSINGASPEIIINTKENISAKLDYYENAYNEDLSLKNNNNIKIVKYLFCEDKLDLLDYFSFK